MSWRRIINRLWSVNSDRTPQDSPQPASAPPEMQDRTRHSPGLEELSRTLSESESLHILDCGELLQANVSYITGYGHKLYSEALLSLSDSMFGAIGRGEELDDQRIQAFLKATLDFPPEHLGAALLWDALEFLPAPVTKALVQTLAAATRPGACLLALFHADERAPTLPTYHYRIVAPDTLHLSPKGWREPVQRFNNRAIEKLFHSFQSVKFFLGRDSLREVIIRR